MTLDDVTDFYHGESLNNIMTEDEVSELLDTGSVTLSLGRIVVSLKFEAVGP